jgi:hypothetical protein
MQCCIFVAVLLVFQAYCDSVSLSEAFQGGIVWDYHPVYPQFDVLFPQGNGLALIAAFCIFAHLQEEEKCQDHQVCCHLQSFVLGVSHVGHDPPYSRARESLLGLRWRINCFAGLIVIRYCWVEFWISRSCFSRVVKSLGDHELRAFAKRPLDLRPLNFVSIVESTLPECDSKGQEQHCSFHVVGGALAVGQQRMLANSDGKLCPVSPMSVVKRAS